MSNWRDQILNEFTPKVARLTLVSDPDGLLREEGIFECIRERGYELTTFENPVAFRYEYESKFRSSWDRGENIELVAVLHSHEADLSSLPYDIFKASHRLSFSINDIFPNLSYLVVAELDKADFDALYRAQKQFSPGQLGDNATKKFILRHVFEIVPELIKQSSDLIKVLLRRHYSGQQIPYIIDEWFIKILRHNKIFDDWPLEILISDREMFFAFLQERWPIFLNFMATKDELGVGEVEKHHELSIDGPSNLPFDHQDIRIYIDNLFVEGFLHPVSHPHSNSLSKTWISIGIRIDTSSERLSYLKKLIGSLQASIPTIDSRHSEWFQFARIWAKLILLINELTEIIPEKTNTVIHDLQKRVDNVFTTWLYKRFAGLVNLPPVPPVMLHHIPRFISRQIIEDPKAKVALLIVDGLSLDQWLVVRETLSSQQFKFRFYEQEIFAWIPSLTSVSRQATFAGKPPIYFPNSIQFTDKEPEVWTQFWTDKGLAPTEVIYAKGLGDNNLMNFSETLLHPKIRIAGLVIDKVDKIMHGMELGSAGMHNQVRQWAQQPYLTTLLDLLLDQGFSIYLTSDHGNIEADGCGHPSEGVIADLRGERVRIFSDAALRNRVKKYFPDAIEWESIGLPIDYYALIAPHRKAFIQEGKRVVCHGGTSIEELIVPFIKLER